MHRAKKIASDFNIKTKHLVEKYIAVGFSSRFVHSTINNFIDGKDNLIIHYHTLWCCLRKGRHSQFPKHFHLVMKHLRKHLLTGEICFTNEKCKFNVLSNTRK